MAEEEKMLRPLRTFLRMMTRMMIWVLRAKYATKDDVVREERLLRLLMLPQYCPAILNIPATQTQQPAIRDLSRVIQCQRKVLQAFIEVQHGTVRHLSLLLDSVIESNNFMNLKMNYISF